MNQIYSNFSASITELKKNPNILLEKSKGKAIAILNHNVPIRYFVPADTYENIMHLLEDQQLAEIVLARENEMSSTIEVNLDDL